MSRLKLFVVLGFAIMFVAGLEVGRSHTTLVSFKSDLDLVVSKLSGHSEPPPATQPAKPDTTHLLFGEIPLSASQDEQVHKIFHEAHVKTDAMNRQFRDLDRVRDEEIVDILDPSQKIAYDQIQQERDARVAELRTEIGDTMAKASAEVRALLSPDQQKQFDEVKKKFDENNRNRHGGPPWRGGPGHRSRNDSQTEPSPDTAPSH